MLPCDDVVAKLHLLQFTEALHSTFFCSSSPPCCSASCGDGGGERSDGSDADAIVDDHLSFV